MLVISSLLACSSQWTMTLPPWAQGRHGEAQALEAMSNLVTTLIPSVNTCTTPSSNTLFDRESSVLFKYHRRAGRGVAYTRQP